MSKQGKIEAKGTVVEICGGSRFKVKLDKVDTVIEAYPSGKMRRKSINIILKDKVDIEMSPYDLTRGRIVWRHK